MNRDEFRARLHDYGFAGIAEPLLTHAQDAIALQLIPETGDQLRVGVSRVGGVPDGAW